jgi:hypothetical protein
LITQVYFWLADVDWRIVAIAIAGISFWRRHDLAAIRARLSQRPSKRQANGPLEYVDSGVEVTPAAPADPVDRALLEIQRERDEIVAELVRLEVRVEDLHTRLARIDALFAKPPAVVPEFVR